MKTKAVAEYGDFQTPTHLAHDVCRVLANNGVMPASVLEPTCGVGRFLIAALDRFASVKEALGMDINAGYVEKATAALRDHKSTAKVKVAPLDFFATDWQRVLEGLPEPVLVLGNLPWVTNAHLEALGSQNLPEKNNFQGRTGLDAITGKANFDISEWMLIRLLDAMTGRRGTIAMLVKSAVARKALYHAWKNGIAVERSSIHRIDAGFHFDAAVDAALLVMHFADTVHGREARVYPGLNDIGTPTIIGYEDGTMFANIEGYRRCKHLAGEERVKWRSGIKHDCSKVMEFDREGRRFRNGLDELIELEEEYMYPMLKSSGVANGCRGADVRWMLVTQKTIGQDTSEIEGRAPSTWAYLTSHAKLLDRRGSTIYRNRPPFSIFGVGNYSFSPWKVAISGFYKRLSFTVVGPHQDKPIVLDDTSYFLPCKDEVSASYLADLLSSSTAKAFYSAFVFWDAKRPITADLLGRLDLRALARELVTGETYDLHFGKESECAELPKKRPRKRKASADPTGELWPSSS